MKQTPLPPKQPTNGLRLKIDFDGASQGVSDDQWRGGQVVGSRQWVDTTLKVPITGQHAASHQVTL